MRFLLCNVWFLIAGLVATQTASTAGEKKPSPKDFFGVWIEEKHEAAGKVYDQPGELFGWDLAANDIGCWERRGEAVYSKLGTVRINVEKDPVWFDIIGEKAKAKVGGEWVEVVAIRPGIVKREGTKLIWVWAKGYYQADPNKLAEWTTRPKSFDVKKDDPWEKMTLYPGSGRYAMD